MFLDKLFIFVNMNICIHYTFISFYLYSQTHTHCKQTFLVILYAYTKMALFETARKNKG